MSAAVLDVRDAQAYGRGHRAGAANIPLEELAERVYELPPPDVPLVLFDDDAARAERASAELASRGRRVECVVSDRAWLDAGPIQTGTTYVRLWRPHALLERAVETVGHLWRGSFAGRRAADLACGTGRDAVFLASLGFSVVAIDVLPDALQRAEALAARMGVCIRTRCTNLEREPKLETDAFDLVAVFRFLHRPLLPMIAATVRPGGFVVYETFLAAHRERFGRPGRDEHLLRPGELRAAFAEWRTLIHEEGAGADRAITARLIAQRPA